MPATTPTVIWTIRPAPTARRAPRRDVRLGMLSLAILVTAAAGAGPPSANVASPPEPAAADGVIAPIYFPLAPRRDSSRPDQQYPDDLLRQFMDYHTAGQYELAAEMALRLVEAAPDEAISHYNLACAMARLRRAEEALDALRQAVQFGWRNNRHTAMDPDLEPIRGSEHYAAIILDLRHRAEAERLVPGPLREDPIEAVVSDLESHVMAEMDAARVPGIAIAYVRDGAVVWTGTFGARDALSGHSLESTDRFELWTPSHALALVAAAQQAHDGHAEAVQFVRSVIDLHAMFDDEVRPEPRPRLAMLEDPDRRSRLHATALASPAPRTVAASARRADLIFELLCHEVEQSGDADFRTYCRSSILEPLGMQATSFIGIDGEIDVPVVTGHSQFGTPVSAETRRVGGRGMRTTAADLGQFIACFTRRDDQVATIARAMAAAWPQTGLALRTTRTAFGERIEITEDRGGSGCLVRCYPNAGTGIVILYNGQRGAEAATRLAHRALGGDA